MSSRGEDASLLRSFAVTIPGRGDLSPPRHRRSLGHPTVALVVVALLVAGGYAGYRGLRGTTSAGSPEPPTTCKPAAELSLFAPARQVHVTVLNASLQTGLAAAVRAELRRRGFHVAAIGNAPRLGRYVATIRYSPDELRASRAVAAEVPGEATIQPVPGHHVLVLDLGTHFTKLQSVSAARATERRRDATATAAAHSPSPSPSASCSPGS